MWSANEVYDWWIANFLKKGSLFQVIFLAKYADKCFDKFCPSLQKVDKKEKSTIQKRLC